MANPFSDTSEFKYGWPVVFAAATGIGLGMSPLPFYTIGVFAVPLSREFGWGMDKIMSAMPVFTFGALIMSPLIGLIGDRIGVRKTALISLLLFGLTFICFMFNTGSLNLYLLLWGVLAITGAGTLPITWTRAVNNWFHQNRGLALGLSLIATGIFGSFAKLFASWLIGQYGWRMAYLGVGLLPILIALPIAWFCFYDTDDPKAADRVSRLRAEYPQHSASTQDGLSFQAALADPRFWLLALAFVPISFAVGGPIPNLERLLGSKGFDASTSVVIASFIGYSVLAGRLLGGYLLDRLWAPGVAFVLLIIPAISCYLLQQSAPGYGTAVVAVVILGIAAGVEYDLMAYLVSRYFGMKSYAAIYGTLYGFFALGAGFGPYLFGRSFAQTGSYNEILSYAGMAFVAGSLPLLFLGKYPVFHKMKEQNF